MRKGIAMLALCALWSCVCAVQAAESGSALTIIERYKDSLAQHTRWSMKTETRMTILASDQQPNKAASVYRTTYYRDGNRIDLSKSVTEYDKQGNLIQRDKGIHFRRILEENHWLKVKDEGSKEQWVSAGRDVQAEVRKAYSGFWGGEFLDGRSPGDPIPIPDMLLGSDDLTVREEKESIDGSPCFVVQGDTLDYGRITLWIDPERGYLPRKATIHKSGDDFYAGRRLSEPRAPLPPGVKYAESPPPLVVESFATVDSIQIEEIEGVFVPTGMRLVRESVREDGSKTQTTQIHTRTDIDLSPNFEAVGAFDPGLPDGTPVNHQYFPGLAFEIRNGKVQPYIDDNVLADIYLETGELHSRAQEFSAELVDEIRETKGKDGPLPSMDSDSPPRAGSAAASSGVSPTIYVALLGLLIAGGGLFALVRMKR